MQVLRLWAASRLVAAVLAQSAGWAAGQVNATMCSWEQPRVAVVRDTLYIDGGLLFWIPGMNDSSYGTPNTDNNPLGIIWTLNFSTPFAVADNITARMTPLPKVNDGASANNIAPNYYDGALLANDNEFFLYGGLLADTDAYTAPAADLVSLYQLYQYGAYKAAFRPGLLNAALPTGLTRYLAYGGAASAPSENKAWYFSGMHAPSWGPIYSVAGNDSLTAVNVSSTLVAVDMATQQSESWSNTTLPSIVAGRANPELVWVPVGAQGILVAIGGVTHPEWVSVTALSDNEAASKAASPAFVTTIDVYDIANKTWYKQPTTGGSAIGQRTRACAVVAAAPDASSFNIYYYGGFDGLDVTAAFSDDVWVLSLPSFTWTRVYASANTEHGRIGHKCVKPYPDQMFVVGGYAPLAGTSLSCLDGGIVQLFNLSSATWMDAYTPVDWSEYAVPDAVVKVIGGSGRGGATATAPAASGGWAATGLKNVFATAYATSKITNYYPYALNTTSAPTSSSPTTNTSAPASSGSHTPKFLAPLLGVIGGLILLTLLGLGAFLYRKRQMAKNGTGGGGSGRRASGTNPDSEATYDTHRNVVFRWLHAQQSVKHVSAEGTSWDGDHNGLSTSGAPHSTGTPISPAMAATNAAHASPGGVYQPSHSSPLGMPSPHSDGHNVSELIADNVFASELSADATQAFELPADFPGSNSSSTDTSGNTKVGSASGFYAKPVSAELESPLQHVAAAGGNSDGSNPASHGADADAGAGGGSLVPRADSPSLGLGQPSPSPPHPHPHPQPQPTPPSAASPFSSAAAPFRASTISDMSDQDRTNLRSGSESSASAASPTGTATPAAIAGTLGSSSSPPPIPEASAGAEAAAEEEAAAAARTQTVPAEASPSQSRRSVFRESEADLKE